MVATHPPCAQFAAVIADSAAPANTPPFAVPSGPLLPPPASCCRFAVSVDTGAPAAAVGITDSVAHL